MCGLHSVVMLTRTALLSMFVFTLQAQVPPDLEKKLDESIMAALKKANSPSISVAVALNGKLAYAKAFGNANLEQNRAADVNTRYSVGSISKQFTAAALLLLQDRHRLSLDDKVSKYFPDLMRAGEITIRQLLSHTSGYEDYAPQDYLIPEWTHPTTPRAVLDHWAKKPLTFDPGTKWEYSNTNYKLAGEIFEKVSGQPLVAFLRENIFKPLGMTSASTWLPVAPGDASPYTRYAAGPPRPVGREAEGWNDADGELVMTPSDLARWDIAVLEKRRLSARAFGEFTREVKLANGEPTHYGLGLFLTEISNIPVLQHGGEVSGFKSWNGVFPTRGAAIVVFTNQDAVDLTGPVSREIASILFLPPVKEPSPESAREAERILAALQQGSIDRSLFTANANTYFTETALADFKTSLAPFGKLGAVTPVSENTRGGMIHRTYRVEFDRSTLSLNIYVLPDGKYEQFLLEVSA